MPLSYLSRFAASSRSSVTPKLPRSTFRSICARAEGMANSSKPNAPNAFNPDTLCQPPPTYCQVSTTPITSTTKLITLAGQIGDDPVTGHFPRDLIGQVKNAHKNIEVALNAVGATPRDIIHVRHYIVQDSQDENLNKLPIVQRGWGKLWMDFMDQKGDGHRPPDTVLGVAGLASPGLLYEIECWAIVH